MPTKIEWSDETWNPIRARNRETGRAGHFCVHVSPGCEGCYAAAMQARLFGNPIRYAAQDAEKVEIFLHDHALMQPLRWRRPRRIFVCSMTDLFYEGHSDDLIAQVFAIMAAAPQHTFQVLTKRPLRMLGFSDYAYAWQSIVAEWAGKLCEDGDRVHDAVLTGPWPLPNVWLGVSAEDQKRAWERIPLLLQTPAAVRFLSAEPLLGAIDLNCFTSDDPHVAALGIPRGYPGCFSALTGSWWPAVGDFEKEFRGRIEELPKLDQVIVGGESGPHARPMHPKWARDLRDQCQAAGVAYFLKQWGEWQPQNDDWDNPKAKCWADGDGLPRDWRDRPNTYLCMKSDGERTSGYTGDALFFKRVGKKRAGRLLDGRTWEEMPT